MIAFESRPAARKVRTGGYVCAVMLVGAIIAGCGGGSAASGGAEAGGGGPQHVNFGLNVPTDFNLVLPQYVAKDRGFFEQAGLDVETVSFQGGADAVKAMVAGSIDIDAATGFDAPAAVAKGAPLKVIAGGISKSSFQVVANNQSGVETLRDMKGKKIAITKFGSLTDFVARVEGHRVGLEAGKDFKEIPVGASSIAPALEKGEVDLANLNPVNLFSLLDAGKNIHVVTKFTDVNPDTQFVVLVARPDYIKEHAATIKKFLQAYYKAIEYLKTHRSYGITATMAALHVNKKVATQLYDALAADMNVDGTVNLKGLQAYAKYLPTLGIAPKVPKLDEYYTDQFIPVKGG